MSRLKNITSGAVTLQMFNTVNPQVNAIDMPVVLELGPGEDVSEQIWLVSDITKASYNQDLINNYIGQEILTRISGV